MIYRLGYSLHAVLPSLNVVYCEKLVILVILSLLYALIILIFVYYTWKECTNIVDLIQDINHNKTYYTRLFHRNDMYCNSMDVVFIIYLVFLLSTLMLNIIFGIIYEYYRKYKNSKVNKDKSLYTDKIIIHIPLYNEDYDTIKSTIDSICSLNFTLDNILILIVVDGIITNKESNCTTDYTLLNLVLNNTDYIDEYSQNEVFNNTIDYKNNKLKLYNGKYKTVNYSVILKCGNDNEIYNDKRGNRGKKDSVLIIYETINNSDTDNCYNLIVDKIEENLDIPFISYKYMLILDCDTDVEQNGLILLLNYINVNPKCIAVCGQTIVKNKNENYITMVQSFEYFISHLLLKTYEHILYNIFVLSGCFTLLKLRHSETNEPIINTNIINKYTKEANSLYQKNLLELGEDRYLTVLMIQEYPNNNISYISDAKCYTNVPNTFKILIDQRRRWTNSLITCLALLGLEPPTQSIFRHMKMYLLIIMELFIIFILPLVIIIGLINTVISITVQGYSFIPLLITIIIILLNLIVTVLALKIDMILRFIPFFFFLPIFSIFIPLYSIINLDNLKWGLTRDAPATNDSNELNEIITPLTPVEIQSSFEKF